MWSSAPTDGVRGCHRLCEFVFASCRADRVVRPYKAFCEVAVCCANLRLRPAGRGKPLPYVTTKDRGCGGGRSGAGGVEPRPYGVTGGAVCGQSGSSAPTGGLRGWWVGENDERMLTNADFLGTLSSKLCDDKDEYGFFRVQRAAGGCEAVAGRPEYPLGAAR